MGKKKEKEEPRWKNKGPVLTAVALTSMPFMKNQPEIQRIQHDDGSVTFKLPITPRGKWVYSGFFSEVVLNHDDEWFARIQKNYRGKLLGADVPTKKTHDPPDQLALGWDVDLREDKDTKWLFVEVTPTTEELEKLILSRQARYVSMEYLVDYKEAAVGPRLSCVFSAQNVVAMSEEDIMKKVEEKEENVEVPVVENVEKDDVPAVVEEVVDAPVEDAVAVLPVKEVALRLVNLELRECLLAARERVVNGNQLSPTIIAAVTNIFKDLPSDPHQAALHAVRVMLEATPRTIPVVAKTAPEVAQEKKSSTETAAEALEKIDWNRYWAGLL